MIDFARLRTCLVCRIFHEICNCLCFVYGLSMLPIRGEFVVYLYWYLPLFCHGNGTLDWQVRHQWSNTDALQWRHNGCDTVSNHQPRECFLIHLIRQRSKKTSKLRVTGLGAGNSLETGEFPAQRASDAENVSIWWRHHWMSVMLVNAKPQPNAANSQPYA